MWHPKTADFDDRLKKLFDEVDAYVEDIYGETYALHPVRPVRGATSNPEADGLFDIGAVFTPGFGSELGRGYLIDIKMSTLEDVKNNMRNEIYEAVAEKVKALLPLRFPERELTVRREQNHFKIQGDFGLGSI